MSILSSTLSSIGRRNMQDDWPCLVMHYVDELRDRIEASQFTAICLSVDAQNISNTQQVREGNTKVVQ